MYCSQREYEYFCTTGNKNFKCVFSNPFWTDWRDIPRFSWPIDLKFGGDLQRIYLYRMNYGFQNLMFFSIFFFFTTQKTKSTRKVDILTLKCCHFFNFRNFAVSLVHAIAISIPIKMHFGFLVSNNQVDRNQPFVPIFKNMLYLRLYNFHNFH